MLILDYKSFSSIITGIALVNEFVTILIDKKCYIYYI